VSAAAHIDHAVGPVLQASPLGWAIVAAIEASNDNVEVQDEGAYLRVFGRRVCVVSSAEVEAQFGQPIQFPGDLEVIMSSFSGLMAVSETGAVWWRSSEPRPELPS
jgi:toluene monooxygenase system protein D